MALALSIGGIVRRDMRSLPLFFRLHFILRDLMAWYAAPYPPPPTNIRIVYCQQYTIHIDLSASTSRDLDQLHFINIALRSSLTHVTTTRYHYYPNGFDAFSIPNRRNTFAIIKQREWFVRLGRRRLIIASFLLLRVGKVWEVVMVVGG